MCLQILIYLLVTGISPQTYEPWNCLMLYNSLTKRRYESHSSNKCSIYIMLIDLGRLYTFKQ